VRAIAAELKSGSELYREVMLDKLTHARESVWIAAFAAISRLVREAPAAVEEAVIVDKAWVYLGNANLTGAGLGTKADGRRNFELGLCTEDFDTLDRVSALFESIWSGAECGSCSLRHICPDPIAPPPRKSLVHLGHPRRLAR